MALAPHFRHVQAIDPAKKMVEIGLQHPDPVVPRIEYRVGSAEDLSRVAPVDLVVAGQAAHWFDYPKVWREFSQCVRPGGTVAFIVSAPAYTSDRAMRRWSFLVIPI